VHNGQDGHLQKGVYLLRDPLKTEIIRRRNRVAKHIKSKEDAKETMLVLCQEGKVEYMTQGFVQGFGFEEDEVPVGKTKSNSGSDKHQPPSQKKKPSQAKPKVKKSVNSEPARSANLFDGKNPELRALLAGLPSSQIGDWEKGVHKASRKSTVVLILLV
jgi:hypothetical protein